MRRRRPVLEEVDAEEEEEEADGAVGVAEGEAAAEASKNFDFGRHWMAFMGKLRCTALRADALDACLDYKK